VVKDNIMKNQNANRIVSKKEKRMQIELVFPATDLGINRSSTRTCFFIYGYYKTTPTHPPSLNKSQRLIHLSQLVQIQKIQISIMSLLHAHALFLIFTVFIIITSFSSETSCFGLHSRAYSTSRIVTIPSASPSTSPPNPKLVNVDALGAKGDGGDDTQVRRYSLSIRSFFVFLFSLQNLVLIFLLLIN
jgi:hypothetical protein